MTQHLPIVVFELDGNKKRFYADYGFHEYRSVENPQERFSEYDIDTWMEVIVSQIASAVRCMRFR